MSESLQELETKCVRILTKTVNRGRGKEKTKEKTREKTNLHKLCELEPNQQVPGAHQEVQCAPIRERTILGCSRPSRNEKKKIIK